jgi:hypothetical protein
MLYAFILIVTVVLIVLFVSSAYAIWYAKTGRYELDNRLDNVAKR